MERGFPLVGIPTQFGLCLILSEPKEHRRFRMNAVLIESLVVRAEDRKKTADRVTYTAIAIGYPIFTAGALIFGAIWAESAWGSYWSWDPKETWALITWFVYTAYLHSRLVKRFRGTVTAWLALIGFLFTMFTFFGVNYLLAGLHSYA